MYIRKIVDENIGPIKNINISFAFNSDGTPKPIVLVGENGSGKSTLLSNIVDAFYEIVKLLTMLGRQLKMEGINITKQLVLPKLLLEMSICIHIFLLMMKKR